MDLEIVILSEVSQAKDKYHDITYMWNLKKNDTNELIYKTERCTDRKQMHHYEKRKRDKLGV